MHEKGFLYIGARHARGSRKTSRRRPENAGATEIVWDKATGKLQVIYKEIASEEITSGGTRSGNSASDAIQDSVR
jgi:hypothetical protein